MVQSDVIQEQCKNKFNEFPLSEQSCLSAGLGKTLTREGPVFCIIRYFYHSTSMYYRELISFSDCS